jgi:hypothetical protein
MTPARADLASINVEIAAGAAERDEAQRLLDQSRGPNSELATVELQLAQLRSQRDSDRAAWNDAGCVGDPPADPPDLLTLERARFRLRERLGADDGALQAAAETVRRAQDRHAALTLQKRSVHLRATIEAVRERRLDAHAVPAIVASLNELAAIQSIAAVLAGRQDPESISASRAIDLLVLVARRSYGVRGDLEAAHRFLEELAGDPAARIPEPAAPMVERLDPGIPRGTEDGSAHVNRGLAENPLGAAPGPGLVNPAIASLDREMRAGPSPGLGAGLPEWLESTTPTFMPSRRAE